MSESSFGVQEYAADQDRKVKAGRLTRFKVVMEFEIEVQGGKVDPIAVMRSSADYSHEVAGKLVKVLRKATGRKSLGCGQSGCGPQKSMYAVEGEDPFLPVTEKALGYGKKKP